MTAPVKPGYLTTGFSHLACHEECRWPTGNLVSTPGKLSSGGRAPHFRTATPRITESVTEPLIVTVDTVRRLSPPAPMNLARVAVVR